MRTLAKAATSSIVALGIVLVLVVVTVAAIGVLGILAAVQQGTVIAGGELTTAVVTEQLGRNMDAAYATGEAALQGADPARRSRLLSSLDAGLLPVIDAQISSLEQLHTGDPPAEYADLTGVTVNGSGPPANDTGLNAVPHQLWVLREHQLVKVEPAGGATALRPLRRACHRSAPGRLHHVDECHAGERSRLAAGDGRRDERDRDVDEERGPPPPGLDK